MCVGMCNTDSSVAVWFRDRAGTDNEENVGWRDNDHCGVNNCSERSKPILRAKRSNKYSGLDIAEGIIFFILRLRLRNLLQLRNFLPLFWDCIWVSLLYLKSHMTRFSITSLDLRSWAKPVSHKLWNRMKGLVNWDGGWCKGSSWP
jgi:hypothetical protein